MNLSFIESFFSKRNAQITDSTSEYTELKSTLDNNISIHKACSDDINQIYDILLSSDDCFMNIDQIEKRLSSLFVLAIGQKLLAVIYYENSENSSRIKWTVIHPMYPENSISSSLRNLISSITSYNH